MVSLKDHRHTQHNPTEKPDAPSPHWEQCEVLNCTQLKVQDPNIQVHPTHSGAEVLSELLRQGKPDESQRERGGGGETKLGCTSCKPEVDWFPLPSLKASAEAICARLPAKLPVRLPVRPRKGSGEEGSIKKNCTHQYLSPACIRPKPHTKNYIPTVTLSRSKHLKHTWASEAPQRQSTNH